MENADSMKSQRRLIAALVLSLSLLLAAFPARSFASEQSASVPPEVYFDDTGQTLGGPFYDAWELRGGLRETGAPVSPAVQQGERWAQWFAYARIEFTTPAIDQAAGEDATAAPIGLAVAETLGLARWHPAFQPFHGYVPEGVRRFGNNHTLANAFKHTWESNDTGERLGVPISEEFRVGDTVYQFFERGALSWHPDYGVNLVPLGYFDAALHSALRLTGEQPEGVPSYDDGRGKPRYVAGAGERWIDVDLSSYVLTAYEGETPVLSTYIVDGAAEYPTVTGTFYVYWKLDKQTMRGRNADGSEYVTEDVPWIMYFYADFALHGAYWRSSFGYSGSHGCVNMPVGDAAWLYSWAPYGTRVEVHY